MTDVQRTQQMQAMRLRAQLSEMHLPSVMLPGDSKELGKVDLGGGILGAVEGGAGPTGQTGNAEPIWNSADPSGRFKSTRFRDGGSPDAGGASPSLSCERTRRARA